MLDTDVATDIIDVCTIGKHSKIFIFRSLPPCLRILLPVQRMSFTMCAGTVS